MKTTLFCACLCLGLYFNGLSQQSKNYVLEINGDTVSVALDENSNLRTKNGENLNITLRLKQVLEYSDNKVSFSYPSSFTYSKKTMAEEGLEQIMLMSAVGNGIVVQLYETLNPEMIVDILLESITEESKDAGYKETLKEVEKKLGSGTLLKGKESTLELNDEISIYAVYAMPAQKGGLLVMTMINDPEEKADLKLFDMVFKTLRAK